MGDITRVIRLLKDKSPKYYSLVYSFITNDDTRSFCGQCRLRSDCTEREV